MLIPATLPVDLAWFNAQHGIPCYGAYAIAPPDDRSAPAWTLTIPWSFFVLGPGNGKPVLVVPPTLPGLAWTFCAGYSHGYLASENPPPGVAAMNHALRTGVVWLGPLAEAITRGPFGAVARLDPLGPPPGRDELLSLSDAVSPGGRIVLAFQAREHTPLDLPPCWSPAGGDRAVVPGAPGFQHEAHEAALRDAWLWDGSPIAVIACEKIA